MNSDFSRTEVWTDPVQVLARRRWRVSKVVTAWVEGQHLTAMAASLSFR